jgi:hypothetical protein
MPKQTSEVEVILVPLILYAMKWCMVVLFRNVCMFCKGSISWTEKEQNAGHAKLFGLMTIIPLAKLVP